MFSFLKRGFRSKEGPDSLPLPKKNGEGNWQFLPSKIAGYQHNYSLSLENGDFLSLDFSPSRRLLQITLSLASQNEKEYIATIKEGRVIQERERISRAPVDMSQGLSPFIELFGQIPDPSILRVMGGNFGAPKILAKDNPYNLKIYDLYLPRNPWKLFKEYLERKQQKEAKTCSRLERLWRRLPQEFFDLGSGAFLLYMLNFHGWVNFAELACLAGFYGVFSGAFDWLWRKRSPFLPKVVFFLGLSALLVYQQVQYRMWGLYL